VEDGVHVVSFHIRGVFLKPEKAFKHLDGTNPAKRRDAMDQVVALSREDPGQLAPFVPNLVHLSTDKDRKVSWRAADILSRISEKNPELFRPVLPTLGKAVKANLKKNSQIVEHYATLAGLMDVVGNVSRLDPNSMGPAASMIAKCLSHPIYRPELDKPGTDILYLNAIRAAGKIAKGSPKTLSRAGPQVARCYLDSFRYERFRKNSNVRGSFSWWSTYTLFQLGSHGRSNIVPALVKELDDNSRLVQKAIADYLSKNASDKKLVQLVGKLHTSPDPEIARNVPRALSILGQHNPKPVMATVSPWMKPGNKQATLDALRVVGDVGQTHPGYLTSVMDQVAFCMRSRDIEIRRDAVNLVGRVGQRHPDSVSSMVPLVMSLLNDRETIVRHSAINTLGILSVNRPEYARPALGKLYQLISDPQKRWQIAEIFQRVGVNVSEYESALKAIQHTWAVYQDALRTGVDLTDAEDVLSKAREAFRNNNFSHAITFGESTVKIINRLREGTSPEIKVHMALPDRMVMGRFLPVKFVITNTGNANAGEAVIESPQLVEVDGDLTVGTVPPGESVERTIQWNPHLSGEVPLNIKVHYLDQDNSLKSKEYVHDAVIEEPSDPAIKHYSTEGFVEEFGVEGGGYSIQSTPSADLVRQLEEEMANRKIQSPAISDVMDDLFNDEGIGTGPEASSSDLSPQIPILEPLNEPKTDPSGTDEQMSDDPDIGDEKAGGEKKKPLSKEIDELFD